MSGRRVHTVAAALFASALGAAAAPAADVRVIHGSTGHACAGYPCEIVQSGVRVIHGIRYEPPVYVPVPEPYYLVNLGPTFEPAVPAYPDVIYAYPYLPPFGYYSYQRYNPYGRYGYRPMGYPGYRPLGSHDEGYFERPYVRRAPMEKSSRVQPKPRPKP
jgi:hypothetical protein